MIDYTSILSGTLLDYTEWLLRQKGLVPKNPNELTGIFYNKLISRLSNVYNFPDLRRSISVTDLIITYTPEGYIEYLSTGGPNSGYYSPSRTQIKEGLSIALVSINVKDYRDRFAYDLSKVILDLKKDLNYGRQQTTTSS